MDIPTIINHNYYVIRGRATNRTWICEAKKYDNKDGKLYYHYGTYELGSKEHKNNEYLNDNYYDILPSENDEIRLATMEEIDILMDILEKNGIVITLQEAKDKAKAPDLKGEDYSGKRFGYKIPDGYEFDAIDNGKIILKPIKLKYLTTYEKCCEMLGVEEDLWFVYEDIDANHINPACISNYRMRKLDLYHNLEKLLICRDAYWKIADNWKPDWNSVNDKYTIYPVGKDIWRDTGQTINTILAFPTIEMRDAFYENFKELIEECKELL